MALVKGEVAGKKDVLVRVHSECLSRRHVSLFAFRLGEKLEYSLATIEAEGQGVLLYLAQEGAGSIC